MSWRRGLFCSLVAAACFYGNVAQKTECTQAAVADIVFLVDGSWSIGEENFQLVRRFLHTLVSSFDVGPERVRIGLAQYSDMVHTEFRLDTFGDKATILRHVDKLSYMGGGTHTGLGLRLLADEHFSAAAGGRAHHSVPQIAVVITDGMSQDDVAADAQRLRERGVVIYAVGIKDADEEQLREIASRPEARHVYNVADFSALQGISQSVVQMLCTTVEEAQGQVNHMVPECMNATVADIVFVVDGSGSIGDQNFQEVRRFLRSFVEGVAIGPEQVRVGLLQYSSEPHQEFLLKDHTDRRTLLAQVDALPYRGGSTFTGWALNFTRERFFTKEAGSRDERVPQIAVVITDGDSVDDVVVPARLLRGHGVIVFAIAVGDANVTELSAIANRPARRFLFSIDSYHALGRLSESLLRNVCSSVEAQEEALAQKFGDVFFLVDNSLSQADFQQTRNLIIRLGNQLNVGASAHRMGLATFGEDTKVDFLLNAYTNKDDTMAHLRKFRLPRRQTTERRNLGHAMNIAHKHFFNKESGSREEQGFRQFLIVVSAGDSEDKVYKASRVVKASRVTVVGVGLGSTTDRQMKVVATAPHIYKTANIVPSLKTLIDTEEESSGVTEDCKTAILADVVFIVDESGSIGTSNFNLVRTFLHSIVENLDVGFNRVRIGIVMFSDEATVRVFLDTFNDKAEVLQFIKLLAYHGGGTDTAKALKMAREEVFVKERGSRAGFVQQVAVVITDGESESEVSQEAAELRRAGVTIYAVGVKDANETQLIQMASNPSNKYVYNVENFAKLKTLEQSLQKVLCHNILRQAFTIQTRRAVIKEGCVQKDEADIYFLIDQSGSIFPNDFYDMKKFIVEFINTFRIGPQHIRIGVVKYADSPTLEFNLVEYTDAASLEKAVLKIDQKGGGTETGAALSFMGPEFNKARASRSYKVPEYLVVITDGKSQDKVKGPAESLRAQGVVIYAIGVKSADIPELEEISGSPQKTFFVNNFDALKPIKDDIVTDICAPEACKDEPGDLLFLIDGSGSIYPEEFKKMKDFMKAIISRSRIGKDQVHVGVMQFSDKQKLEFSLTGFYDKKRLSAAIEGIEQLGGNTLTGEALLQVSEHFDASRGGRPSLRQSLIVITDGEAQDEVKEPAEALRAKGVVVYAVGVVNADTTQLLDISGAQERVYTEKDFDALKDLESTLSSAVCASEEDCKRIEVADIIFLVDDSGSINPSQFDSMRTFMESVVNGTTVGQSFTRFGVIMFSNDPKSMFTLKEYDSKRSVLQAIQGLNHTHGDTYTGKALKYSLQFFDEQHGGRAALQVPQILMVITDGDATDWPDLKAPSDALRDHKISVFSIGVKEANPAQLEIMAGGDKSKVFFVDNFKALETLYANISSVLCNNTKPACKEQDVVILMDMSGSISTDDYITMKNFMVELVSSFNVSKESFRVGVAQFSDINQKEFYLNEFEDETKMNDHILAMTQLGGGTKIGGALSFIKDYFQASRGSRISQGVPQNLILITDGDSQDEVEDAADVLRNMKIEMFAIGVGDIHALELLQITGDPQKLFTVKDFNSLADIKQKVIDATCKPIEPPDEPGCTIDIAMGFDISRRTRPGFLVSGQLRSSLPEIVRQVSSLSGLCCVKKDLVKTSIGFRVVSRDGSLLHDPNFEAYSDDVVRKVMDWQISESTYFNTALLNSFKEKFRRSNAGVKVLVIFSDGLDEDVMKLKQESELLQQSEINALLVVALEGVHDAGQLQMVEFGRGFGFNVPLSISMHSVGSALLKQIDTVADRECCNVTCKCSGHEGPRGSWGSPGTKGVSGPKGHPGYPGEEGTAGDRGFPGPVGPQGIQGCPGVRGPKGHRGYRGERGEDGEHGLDGINGEQGVSGSKGASGEKGNPGDPGIKGITGQAGLKGLEGLRGDPGEPGLDNTLLGPKGEAGNPGRPGEPGTSGVNGETGANGNIGPEGYRGRPGTKGDNGEPADPGVAGSPGPSGPQGDSGVRGQPGQKGIIGLTGPQGGPGRPGSQGATGRRGANGQKGQPGDPGTPGQSGSLGPRGVPGQDGRDGYGPLGPPGIKGEIGFPGYPGFQGETGSEGGMGGPGRKGNRGRGGNAGIPGELGTPGDEGPPGHRGSRGPPGVSGMTECQLINYVRDNCVCSQERAACPAYPTELVLALDMSRSVESHEFERMRSVLLELLSDLEVAESNCPTGARVAVVGYSTHTKHLVRFHDYRRKQQLLDAVRNVALERTASERHLGAAMRFVGRHVFKRVRKGAKVRKVAVFLNGGPVQDIDEVVAAMMEYRAMDIVPVVITLRDSPELQRAFQADDTRSSIYTLLGRTGELTSDLQMVKQCAICYDPCRTSALCPIVSPGPQRVAVDLTLLLDGSREVQGDQYRGAQQLLGSILEQLVVSSAGGADPGAHVALLHAGQGAAKLGNSSSMRQHVQQAGGELALGAALDILLRDQPPPPSGGRRRRSALLAVVGAKSASWDADTLEQVARRVHCKGVAVLVLAVGGRYDRQQVEQLASFPLKQHLLHLQDLGLPEQLYAQRYVRAFLSVLASGINSYPPKSLQKQCRLLSGQDQGQEVNSQGQAELEELEEQQEVFQEQVGGQRTHLAHQEHQVEVTEDFSRGYGEALHRPPVNARCSLQVDAGSACAEFVLRWFFDRSIGTCLQFWYGGCHGNANRFHSERECVQTCATEQASSLLMTEQKHLPSKDVCVQAQDAGSCQNYTMRWFFDTEQGECSRFWYSGCHGNGNRFETQDACESICLTKRR